MEKNRQISERKSNELVWAGSLIERIEKIDDPAVRYKAVSYTHLARFSSIWV